MGRPFTPLLQLLSVLPPQSGRFLPSPYEQVMTSNSSLLAEYYPRDFLVDANGKKNSWECIVRIPFIKVFITFIRCFTHLFLLKRDQQEEELVDAVNKIDHIKELSESERQRNIAGTEHAFKPTPTSSNGKHFHHFILYCLYYVLNRDRQTRRSGTCGSLGQCCGGPAGRQQEAISFFSING